MHTQRRNQILQKLAADNALAPGMRSTVANPVGGQQVASGMQQAYGQARSWLGRQFPGAAATGAVMPSPAPIRMEAGKGYDWLAQQYRARGQEGLTGSQLRQQMGGQMLVAGRGYDGLGYSGKAGSNPGGLSTPQLAGAQHAGQQWRNNDNARTANALGAQRQPAAQTAQPALQAPPASASAPLSVLGRQNKADAPILNAPGMAARGAAPPQMRGLVAPPAQPPTMMAAPPPRAAPQPMAGAPAGPVLSAAPRRQPPMM